MITPRQYYLTEMESPLGPITLVSSDKGLREVCFESAEETQACLSISGISCVFTGLQNNQAATQIAGYFERKRKTFDIPLDLEGTPFQKKVWNALLKIPYGEVCSYKDIAVQVGCPKGSRAVGQACGANPAPIIVPCHRVLTSTRKLGGYSGGLEIKKALLKLERGS